jgi:hypothetical protein
MKSLRPSNATLAYASCEVAAPFVSFQARDLDRTQLAAVLSQHLCYERVRAFRTYLLPRLGVLLLTSWMSTVELHLLPTVALVLTGVAAMGVAAVVARAERRARRRVDHMLRNVCLIRHSAADQSL